MATFYMNNNLPAGCTNADIDRHFGGGENDMKECPTCEGCGQVSDEENQDILNPCPDCDGEGEVEMTDEEQAEFEQQNREAAQEAAAEASEERERDRINDL